VIAPLLAAEFAVGVAVASTDGETAGYGWADLARHRQVEPTTRFRICSVSKIATALLLLRLQEEGLVSLDSPAATYLRAFPTSTSTLRELLTHTAGMPPGVGLRHYEGPVPAPAEYFADGIHAERPAGRFAYSNLGFVVLGQAAADVLGQPYAEAVTEWVLAPLGLTDVAVAPALPADAARLHSRRLRRRRRPRHGGAGEHERLAAQGHPARRLRPRSDGHMIMEIVPFVASHGAQRVSGNHSARFHDHGRRCRSGRGAG
jgi:CubicO group peptidase (beta-lactamase class C family)